MRQERTVQASIFDLFAGHEIGRELKAISARLDNHRDLLGPVAGDLRRHGGKETGRCGLAAESVLRCALLKQHRQLSYQELAFHLEDSASFRAFARLPCSWTPSKSVLQKTISATRAETWEVIIGRCWRALPRRRWSAAGWCASTARSPQRWYTSRATAAYCGTRSGHGPSVEAGEALGAGIALPCRDHQRAAKKRARDIQYTRGRPKRLQLYRELIKITQPPWPICTTLRCSWLEQWVWRSSSGRPRSANIGPYRADHRPD
jgi:IS5 family transposase